MAGFDRRLERLVRHSRLRRLFGTDIGEKGIAFLTLALTVLAMAAFARLSGSAWGNAMRAVRDSETASISIGLDPTLIRTTAFGISAVAAGVAGGVYASISNFISPESFPFFQSILFFLVVMLGGADRVLGPLSALAWSCCCRNCWRRSANTGSSLSAC